MKRDLLILFALAGWALAVPHYGSEFAVSMALTCLMYAALSSSWSLFCGSTRYLSLATSAFFGIGAYASALSLEQIGWLGAIGLGAAIAAAVAVVMGAAVLHLRGTYFAVLTFGMTELIRHAITYWEKQVTGTVGRVLTVVPERDTDLPHRAGPGGGWPSLVVHRSCGAAASAWRWPASAPTSSARRRWA